jgi:SPP1 family predicted phage head-tail adaptor
MQAGGLRHRIDIEQNVGTTDTFGATTDSWALFTTLWAAIEPLSGRELLQAQQIQADITHRVRFRYVSGVTAKMRVLYGSRIFNILSIINPEERNREITLACKELT